MFFQVLQNIRLADIADILLVSVLVYGLLIWLRRTASLTVLAGGPVVAGIYIAAQAFDMYLTSMIFHGLFAVVLIGLIILFQDDLRRTLGRRATWFWLKGNPDTAATAADIDAIVTTVFSLANSRVGALLVLVGREPLGQHIEGGFALHGRFSLPLLCSLFDPHSPGHDGAVIIEDRLVKRFGVHLPLSRNLDRIGDRGTRHSAALGLSERSDALVIVVSEERGTVSVAEDGRLDSLASPADLKARIEQFQASHLPQPISRTRTSTVTKNWPLKLSALALACLGWALLAYQPGLVERTFVVPIEYRDLSDNLNLDGTQPAEARITLSGRPATVGALDPAALKVSLDLSRASAGVNETPIQAADVQRPPNVDVTHIDPSIIRYRLTP
jgi:diadenylate cyclase